MSGERSDCSSPIHHPPVIPALVADWSSLKDDNGFYPGVRVAVAFAEKTGILTGVNRPYDITLGEMALIFSNTDRVFEAAKEEQFLQQIRQRLFKQLNIHGFGKMGVHAGT